MHNLDLGFQTTVSRDYVRGTVQGYAEGWRDASRKYRFISIVLGILLLFCIGIIIGILMDV